MSNRIVYHRLPCLTSRWRCGNGEISSHDWSDWNVWRWRTLFYCDRQSISDSAGSEAMNLRTCSDWLRHGAKLAHVAFCCGKRKRKIKKEETENQSVSSGVEVKRFSCLFFSYLRSFRYISNETENSADSDESAQPARTWRNRLPGFSPPLISLPME